MPEVFTTRDAPVGALTAVRALLDAAFDRGFSDDDWDHALGGWHVVVRVDGLPLAHAAVVARSSSRPCRCTAGYVEAVATAPARQGNGL